MDKFDYYKTQNSPLNYYCDACAFTTNSKRDYKRHLETIKHQNATNELHILPYNDLKLEYKCVYCSKTYKHHSSLWKHKKQCKIKYNENISDEINKISEKELMLMILQDNKELIKAIADLSKNNQTINNNSITNTNSNNSFNLNVYLNETCKNAMNISDFINNIKLTLNDLEYTGRQGYVAGISNIILNNLRSIDKTERPIHCSDLKRETLYIKNDDVWEKDNENKDKLTNAIKMIAFENIKNINEWKLQNPGCTDPDSRKNDLYLNIVSNSMCGLTKEETDKNISKIITNVAKEVVIQK